MKLIYFKIFFLVCVINCLVGNYNSYASSSMYSYIMSESQINQDISTDINTNINTNIDTNIENNSLRKSPTGAIFRSLVLPGWGQIYVENYWKAPIFAAGAGILWYFVIDNTIKYNDYKNQLAMLDPTTIEYNLIKNKRNNAVDTRDLSALYLLGVYVIATVDAYVGAHLFDFNLNNFSENTNFKIYLSPAIMPMTNTNYIKLNIFMNF